MSPVTQGHFSIAAANGGAVSKQEAGEGSRSIAQHSVAYRWGSCF